MNAVDILTENRDETRKLVGFAAMLLGGFLWLAGVDDRIFKSYFFKSTAIALGTTLIVLGSEIIR